MITPPTVFAVDWKTTPSCGARMSVRRELVLGGHLALDVFADLAVGLAQLLGDVAGEFLIDLEDLQLNFGDLALGFGGGGNERAALALQARLLALERGEPVELDEVLRPQIADALELLVDERHFLGLGVLLGGQPGDLLLQLLDALLQLILLAETRGAAQLEQLALARQRLVEVAIVDVAGKLVGQRDGIGAVALGREAGFAGIKLVEALGDDGEIGTGHRLVEAHEDVARLHPVAVVRPDLADHAAGRVLHLLHVRIDDHRALCDQGAGNLRRRGPAAEPDRQDPDQHNAGEYVPADRLTRARRRLVFHPAPPCSGTTFKARGCRPGCTARLRISSFGPNCCCRPLPITKM